MAISTWPAGIPYIPMRDSYGVRPVAKKADVTEMEAGPDRQRATESANWSEHDYAIVMEIDEWEVLKTFLLKTLHKATARFNIPVADVESEEGPHALKMAYIPGGQFDVKPYAIGHVVLSFKLRVLDW